MHAVSLGHLEGILYWLGLEPGRKCQLPLGSFLGYNLNYEEVNKGCT